MWIPKYLKERGMTSDWRVDTYNQLVKQGKRQSTEMNQAGAVETGTGSGRPPDLLRQPSSRSHLLVCTISLPSCLSNLLPNIMEPKESTHERAQLLTRLPVARSDPEDNFPKEVDSAVSACLWFADLDTIRHLV